MKKSIGYIRDTANKTNYNKVVEVLSVPLEENSNLCMIPPYCLSYTHLASEPGSLNSKSCNLISKTCDQLLTAKLLEHDEQLASLIESTLQFNMGAELGVRPNRDNIYYSIGIVINL